MQYFAQGQKMKNSLKFSSLARRLCLFALTSLAIPFGSAVAGDGFGDNTDANGTPIKQQTYYANSPSGLHSPSACYDANGSGLDANGAALVPVIGGICDTGTALRKFKDPLPVVADPGGPVPLGSPAGKLGDGSGKYIPRAIPVKWVNQQGITTADDYYEIAVVEYKEQFHSDLKAGGSLVRGYVQLDPIATSTGGASKSAKSVGVALTNIDGSPIMMPDGVHQAFGYDKPHYLGPEISANRDTPTRLKFVNLLPIGRGDKDASGNPLPGGARKGDLFLPVDEMLPGAGFGPDGKVKYTQNRALLHLHGGDNPWISDGTPHEWITPAGESDANNPLSVAAEAATKGLAPVDAAAYLRGASAVNVPDMPDPGPGAMTYYFPNGESARLMWYHDHSFGLTRLNVYAGEAAAYKLQDPIEQAAVLAGKLPALADEIPLVIQDKTFVPKDIAIQDAKWDSNYWGQEGDLWFPHVYETNQDPTSIDGTKPVGRWDWGPYFWPVFPSYYDRLPNGEHVLANQTAGGVPVDTGLSEVTTTPEAFVDTPVINGQAYPTMTVEPKAYRFRMLNAMNDRYVNLGLYVAADAVTTNASDPLDPAKQPVLCDGNQKRLDGSVPALSDCTEVKMVHFDSSYPSAYYPTLPVAPFGNPAAEFKFPDGSNPATKGLVGTGWGDPSGFLALYAGVPDPATAGPDIHLIGNEGGFLANAVTIPSTIMNYEANKRSVTLLNILEKGLFINPAGRADAVIDFSQYAGKTLILYNDSPAPLPAGDPRIDYFTGMGDYSSVGGAENVLPGYGPNDRTMIQIYVQPVATTPSIDVATLDTTIPSLHAQTQPMPVVPEPRYNKAFAGISPATETLARIYTGAIYLGKYNAMTFKTPEAIKYTPAPGSVTANLTNSAGTAYNGGTAIPQCSNAAACQTVLDNVKALGSAKAAAGATINAYVENKAIQELFDPTYGRMNATLGVELPFVSALTQTTIPLGYVDPTTEKVTDGETQFWKITHNGVDSHPVHFHLVNVQVINRVGWDGTLKSPTDDEIGWKETVIMNPLEDIIVAVRAKAPKLPFGLPNSVRARDPSQPVGPNVIEGFTQVDPITGNPAVVSNKVEDFGWEYVWHCHILGHEENDFMRPFVFDYWNDKNAMVAGFAVNRPDQISDLALTSQVLTWTDPTPSLAVTTLANPKNEIGYKVMRSSDDGLPAVISNVIANATSFTDNFVPTPTVAYSYTVAAYNQMGIANASNAVVLKAVLVPVNLTLGTVTGSSVGLSWSNANVGKTTATVVVSNAGGVVQTITPANSPLNVTGLTPNTSYTFSVTVANASGSVSPVASVNATTLAPPSLNAATIGTARMLGASSLALTWTDNSVGETGYQVQYRRNNNGTWNIIPAASVSGTLTANGTGGLITATVSLTMNQSTYQFRVLPLNGAQTGPVSGVVSINLQNQPSTPLITGATSAIGSKNVVLAWNQLSNNTATVTIERHIRIGNNWGPWVTVATLQGSNSLGYTDLGVIVGQTYRYRVRATNTSGNSNWSATTPVTGVIVR
jgi:FtsP/CotA-like multicopper oxidase with cupredoxin domain